MDAAGGQNPFELVRRPDRNPVSRLNTQGQQAARDPLSLVGQIGIADDDSAVDDRPAHGMGLGGQADDLRQGLWKAWIHSANFRVKRWLVGTA